MRKKENQWFYCEAWNCKTTIKNCQNCSVSKKNPMCPEESYKKDKQLEEQVQKVRDMENQQCPKCGEYLVSSLYFAFCPHCGFPDDDEDDGDFED